MFGAWASGPGLSSGTARFPRVAARLAQRGEELLQIRRQRRARHDAGPARGVVEADLGRVEGLAREVEACPGPPRAPRAVDPIADDRMARRREVDAQLVGAAGLGLEAHQGRTREAFERRPARDRGAPAPAVHTHAPPLARMPADGAVDGPVRGAEVTADHGQVDLLDRARTELPRQRPN